MSALIPNYYLIHETPAGTRYTYPQPSTPAEVGKWPGSAGTWGSPDVDTVVVPGSTSHTPQKWVVADRPLSTLVLPWRESQGYGGWVKRENAPDDPIAASAWRTWEDQPSADLLTHWEAADSDSGHCGTCATFRAVYERERLWADRAYEVDVRSWLPLPGVADENPEVAWQVGDTSLTALYGQHTAHLWAGHIPGFRDAVNKALESDRRTQYVFTHNSPDRPHGSTEVVVPVRWETPKSERRRRVGVGGRKLRGMEDVPRPIATSHRTTRHIPEGLAARTKAEAVAAWDSAVAAEVEAFMPPPMRACNNCDGHGFVFTDGES